MAKRGGEATLGAEGERLGERKPKSSRGAACVGRDRIRFRVFLCSLFFKIAPPFLVCVVTSIYR